MKTTLLTLLALFTFALTGCGSNNSPSTDIQVKVEISDKNISIGEYIFIEVHIKNNSERDDKYVQAFWTKSSNLEYDFYPMTEFLENSEYRLNDGEYAKTIGTILAGETKTLKYALWSNIPGEFAIHHSAFSYSAQDINFTDNRMTDYIIVK